MMQQFIQHTTEHMQRHLEAIQIITDQQRTPAQADVDSCNSDKDGETVHTKPSKWTAIRAACFFGWAGFWPNHSTKKLPYFSHRWQMHQLLTGQHWLGVCSRKFREKITTFMGSALVM